MWKDEACGARSSRPAGALGDETRRVERRLLDGRVAAEALVRPVRARGHGGREQAAPVTRDARDVWRAVLARDLVALTSAVSEREAAACWL